MASCRSGDAAHKFTGTFDGAGHMIQRLYMQWLSTDYVGLFGYADSGSVIRNVGLSRASITGQNYVGSFAVYSGGTISKVYADSGIPEVREISGA